MSGRRILGSIRDRSDDLRRWLDSHPGATLEQVREGTGYGGRSLAWRVKEEVDRGACDISEKGWHPADTEELKRGKIARLTLVQKAAIIRDEVRRGIV
jgi:hypothetical protein